MTYITDITDPADAQQAKDELNTLIQKHIHLLLHSADLHYQGRHIEASDKSDEANLLLSDMHFLEELLVHREKSQNRSANA